MPSKRKSSPPRRVWWVLTIREESGDPRAMCYLCPTREKARNKAEVFGWTDPIIARVEL
jgi:hypothetical protein